jgi:hypothetical protein
MAFFTYELVPDRVMDRYAIVAKADGSGPECTAQHDGKVVGYALGMNHENPGLLFTVTLPISAVEKICAVLELRQ